MDSQLEPVVAPVDTSQIEVVRVEDTGEPGDPYEDFLAGGAPDPVESWLEDEEETISINYTSGTTGRPKGVVYTHRGAYPERPRRGDRDRSRLREHVSLDASDVPLQRLVLHMGGHRGCPECHVCLRRVEPGRIWELLDSEGITHYNGAPTVHIGVVNHPAARRLDRESP